jgi:pullulanase
MAGNLVTYRLVDAAGRTVRGSEVDYYGQPAGYALDPQENVLYAEAHDNETLFDAIAVKAPSAPVADRVRLQNLAVDVVMLGQGVAFFHAGTDMLRSKSIDRDSFNSGDWFNRLDFTYRSNNWGAGLPPAHANKDKWPIMQPLLANRAMQPSPAEIRRAVEHFREMLRIRKSTRLFRLRTAAEIESKVRFYNTGPEQVPGLIVMAIDDRGADRIADRYGLVVALVNASDAAQVFVARDLAGTRLALHPVLAASSDPLARTSRFDRATGSFRVPARTTAVFVLRS